MEDEIEVSLGGGVANAGAVVRVGDHVLRPSSANTPSIHRYLTHLREAGFDGASRPIGVDDDGRERFEFLPGDVALPPYPDWVQTDEALVSVGELLAAMHRAAVGFDLDGTTWNQELADAEAGPIVCHNDICLENVVFCDGCAVGFIDFDFAAPGRPVYDVAQFARMCVPLDDDINAARLGWHDVDRPARLRLVADAYGLEPAERGLLVEVLDDNIARVGDFVRRRVEAGDPNFVAMWEEMGGAERYERRHRWWLDHRAAFGAALTAPARLRGPGGRRWPSRPEAS